MACDKRGAKVADVALHNGPSRLPDLSVPEANSTVPETNVQAMGSTPQNKEPDQSPRSAPCVSTPASTRNQSFDETLEDHEEEQEEEEADSDEEDLKKLDFVDDAKSQKNKPTPGKPVLSKSAIRGRLRRLMTPTARGTFKVSESVVQDFQRGGPSRTKIESIFHMLGCNKDRLATGFSAGHRAFEK